MSETLKDLLTSKKFLVFAAGSVAVAILRLSARFSLGLTPEDAASISDRVTALGVAYILGQGAADLGKHAAELQAVTKQES